MTTAPLTAPPVSTLLRHALTPRRVAVALLLVFAVLVRLPRNGAPPVGPHDFRQTQTAITVQAWLDRGFTLLDYETPVLGPPWKIPFEFPTYQASAWVLAKAGVKLDRACRTASFGWFFASALLLYTLARRLRGDVAALVAFAVYVFSPFSLLWGRAILIDYASVALALGYLLATITWAERPRLRLAVLAAALGALAAATKITTVPIVVPGLVLAALAALRRARREGSGVGGTLAVLAGLAAIPLAAGLGWTWWADAVKGASPSTAWLTSRSLAGWNFGSLTQRRTFDCWHLIVSRMAPIVPGLLPALLGPALATLWGARPALRAATAAALCGLVLPILIFFNLYWVHDYYLIAITPSLAFLVGVGAAELLDAVQGSLRAVVAQLAVAAVAVTAAGDYAYASPAYLDVRREPIVELGALVERVTPPDGWIVVEGDDWSSRIPYLSRRRAFMVRPPVAPLDLVAGRPEFATVVCRACTEVLARWGTTEQAGEKAGFRVFRVTAAAASR